MLRFLGNVEVVALPAEVETASHMFLASSEGAIGRVGISGEEGGQLFSRTMVSSTPRCLVAFPKFLFVLMEDGLISALDSTSLAKYHSIMLFLESGETIRSASCLIEDKGTSKVSIFAVVSSPHDSSVSFRMFEFFANDKETVTYRPRLLDAIKVPETLQSAFMNEHYIVVNGGDAGCTIYDRSTRTALESHQGECRSFFQHRFITHHNSILTARMMGRSEAPTLSDSWRCEACDGVYLDSSVRTELVSLYSVKNDFYLRFPSKEIRVPNLGYATVLKTIVYKKKSPLLVLRAENGNVALLDVSGRVLWIREEALAFPKATMILERPGVKDHFRFAKDLIIFTSSGYLFSLPAEKHGKVIHFLANVKEDLLPVLEAPSMKEVQVGEMTEISHGHVLVHCRYGAHQATVSMFFHQTENVQVEVKKVDENALLVTPSFTIFKNYSVSPSQLSHHHHSSLSLQAGHEAHYVFTVNATSGRLSGYVVRGEQAKATWNLELPGPLVAHATAADPRHIFYLNNLRLFPNKTLTGEKVFEVQHRYPTHNMVAVAYYVQEQNSKISTLVVTVVDTITGSIHGTSYHVNVEGDVKMMIAENAVLFYFLDAAKMRYCVGVWELFEMDEGKQVRRDSGASPVHAVASLFPRKNPTFSSLASRPPLIKVHVLGIYGGPVATLGLTTSFQSIARKNVVLVFETGRVAMVELNALLLGRPIFFKEDGAAMDAGPKTQILVSPYSFATHRYRIAQPKLLSVSPTGLESSSHLLVSGMDLFYVRHSSGKAFDLLNTDFNKQLLVALLFGISLACLVARFFAKRKLLSMSWM